LEHSAELWIENARSEGEESARRGWDHNGLAAWRRQKRMVALEENRVMVALEGNRVGLGHRLPSFARQHSRASLVAAFYLIK